MTEVDPAKASQLPVYVPADLTKRDVQLAQTPDDGFLAPASGYISRPGYSEDFLEGNRVPLPKTSRRLAPDVLRPPSGKRWLPFWSYSVLMSRARRLPIVSAANFDRNAKPEKSTRGSTWYYDPRLAKDPEKAKTRQIGDEWYLHQPPARLEALVAMLERTSLFDRGHLTSYKQATFGPDYKAFGLDTFHFTNCAPQAKEFNETGFWRQIEDWTALNGSGKLCIFNGPVFNAPASTPSESEYVLNPRSARVPDPVFNGVEIPKQFFKIAVYEVAGELMVQSFVVTQEEYLAKLQREKFDVEVVLPPHLAVYRLPLADVSHLTGLNFDALAKGAGSVNDAAASEQPELIVDKAQVLLA